jgi:putative membrane protein
VIPTAVPLAVATSWLAPVSRWSFEPAVVVPLVISSVVYVRAARAVARRRPRPSWSGRTTYFLAGIGALALALVSPIDVLADERFSVHMVQHLLLTLVAPPLLLLGRPLTLAVAASSGRSRVTLGRLSRTSPIRFLGSPAFGFGAFTLFLWTSHLTGLYTLALTNDAVHSLEHLAYLFTALAFWWPLVARDPGAARLSYPGRLLYVFLWMPVMSLLGFVITYADRVLYRPYIASAGSVTAALADQRLGGTIMWETSMLGGAVALSAVLLDWMRFDDVHARRLEALRDHGTRTRGEVEVHG